MYKNCSTWNRKRYRNVLLTSTKCPLANKPRIRPGFSRPYTNVYANVKLLQCNCIAIAMQSTYYLLYIYLFTCILFFFFWFFSFFSRPF